MMRPIVTARTLDLRASASIAERFWISGDFPSDRSPGEIPWDGLDVVETRMHATSPQLPLLLWEDVLGYADQAAPLARRYLAGMVRGRRPPLQSPAAPLQFDARRLPVLEDAEFWAVIDALGRSQAESAVRRLSRDLATRDEEFLLRWSQTYGVKAIALLNQFDKAHVADSTPLHFGWLVGSTIGAGANVYADVLVDPTLWRSTWVRAGSMSIEHLGADALSHKLKRDAWIATTYDDYWRTRPDSGVEHPSSLRWTQPAQARRIARTDEEHRATLYAGFALLVRDHDLVMRVVIADANPMEPIGDLTSALESFGGKLVSTVEVSDLHWEELQSGEVFALRRRFSGNRREYVERFLSNPKT